MTEGTTKKVATYLPRVVLVLGLLGLNVSPAGAGSWQEWRQSIDAGMAALAEDDTVKAGALFEDALSMAEAADPTDVRLAVSLDNLAETRFLQNRDVDAVRLYRRALVFRETAFGPNDAAVAESVRRLADVLFFQDQYEEAELLYKRALAIGEQSADQYGVVTYLDSLGRFYNFTGRESDALPYLVRALALRTDRLGPDQVDLAPTLDAMGEAQFYLDRLDEAEGLYRRSLALREAAFGGTDREVAGSLRRLASVIRMRGREDEAARLRAFAIKGSQ